MIVDDQSEAIAFLSSPAAYGRGVDEVERIDTHISVVFLAGVRAYKLKRAVGFDYVDYSTLALRREACEAELRINRRTAPDIYLGVVELRRSADGRLGLGGEGACVEPLVEMVRFDQDGLLDRMARRGALDEALISALADEVHALHAVAERRADQGGRDGMARVIAGNIADLGEHSGDPFEPDRVALYGERSAQALGRHGGLLDARRRDGFVRLCHGDLHLGNICLIEGQPVIFDAIEFNDAIACCDMLYDLAFLVMDLLHGDLGTLANCVLNRYLAMSGDYAGLPPFVLFLSCRAAVRAKITATTAATQQSAALRAEAGRYLDEALAFLETNAPRLVAVGGLSGSGKSTLAMGLAPMLGAPPGAVVLRSDVLRKRLFGRAPSEPLGPEGYTAEVNERVYEALAVNARAALDAGFTAIVDAVHARSEERARIVGVAASAGVPFAGLWLEAPVERMMERIRRRRCDALDASDAGEKVLERQLGYDVGPLDWLRVDAGDDAEAVLARAREALAHAG